MSAHDRPRLIITEDGGGTGSTAAGDECMTPAAFRRALRSGRYLRMLGRYREADLRLYNIDAHGRLWPYALLLLRSRAEAPT